MSKTKIQAVIEPNLLLDMFIRVSGYEVDRKDISAYLSKCKEREITPNFNNFKRYMAAPCFADAYPEPCMEMSYEDYVATIKKLTGNDYPTERGSLLDELYAAGVEPDAKNAIPFINENFNADGTPISNEPELEPEYLVFLGEDGHTHEEMTATIYLEILQERLEAMGA